MLVSIQNAGLEITAEEYLFICLEFPFGKCQLAAAATSVSVKADTASIATAAEDKDKPDQVIVATATSTIITIIAA